MDIQIHIPDSRIESLVTEYVQSLFAAPAYSAGKGGIAWDAIREVARQQVGAIDWAPYVQRAIASVQGEVIAQVVTAEIKRQATTKAKLLLTPEGSRDAPRP